PANSVRTTPLISRTQQGTDRHRRPVERTQIQRKVYCKCTLSDAAHKPRRQEQPDSAGAIIRHCPILDEGPGSAKLSNSRCVREVRGGGGSEKAFRFHGKCPSC